MNQLPSKFKKASFVSDLYAIRNFKLKNCMIIGGAGTIRSNYTKELLYFKPNKIVVVDINENGLTELTRDLRSSKLLNLQLIFMTAWVILFPKSNLHFKLFKNLPIRKFL